MTCKFITTQIHSVNAEYQSIFKWKDHSIEVFYIIHYKFPIHLWFIIIQQDNTTLNLLRPSHINSEFFSQAAFEGKIDYNKKPLDPLETKVLVHNNIQKHMKWSAHGVQCWYIVLSMDHYQCYKFYINRTKDEINADMVGFFWKYRSSNTSYHRTSN